VCGCLGADHITGEITITFSQLYAPVQEAGDLNYIICRQRDGTKIIFQRRGKKGKKWAAVLAGVGGGKAVSG
jgi:hypothetical protein